MLAVEARRAHVTRRGWACRCVPCPGWHRTAATAYSATPACAVRGEAMEPSAASDCTLRLPLPSPKVQKSLEGAMPYLTYITARGHTPPVVLTASSGEAYAPNYVVGLRYHAVRRTTCFECVIDRRPSPPDG